MAAPSPQALRERSTAHVLPSHPSAFPISASGKRTFPGINLNSHVSCFDAHSPNAAQPSQICPSPRASLISLCPLPVYTYMRSHTHTHIHTLTHDIVQLHGAAHSSLICFTLIRELPAPRLVLLSPSDGLARCTSSQTHCDHRLLNKSFSDPLWAELTTPSASPLHQESILHCSVTLDCTSPFICPWQTPWE